MGLTKYSRPATMVTSALGLMARYSPPPGQAQRLQQLDVIAQLADARAFAGYCEQQGGQPATAEQALGQRQETGEIPGCAHEASSRGKVIHIYCG